MKFRKLSARLIWQEVGVQNWEFEEARLHNVEQSPVVGLRVRLNVISQARLPFDPCSDMIFEAVMRHFTRWRAL
jgi:hypothetical protein